MDPTQDPNFKPPSTNPPVEPTVSSKLIPNRQPIQKYVLADYLQPIDQPITHQTMSSSKPATASPTLSNKKTTSPNSIKKHKIPKLPTELQPFSSSEEDEEEQQQQQQQHQIDNVPTSKSSIDDEKFIQRKERSESFNISTTNLPRVHSFQIADLEEVPHGVQRQSKSLNDYRFPTHRLKTRLTDPNKYPLVIVACGSFSPITYLHLRMFEMALDSIRESTKFEVLGGYYSPVSDNYKKPGLAASAHRVRMCELACERTSSWLMVDAWESLQPKYTRTALVLDHFNQEININRGGVLKSNSSTERIGVKIMLLAGGDLIESMGEPNVWADLDLHHILGNYGCLIVERTGSDVRSFLLSHDVMYEHRKNILVIKQLIYNDISSTKVRLFIRRNMSVQYLLPNSVIRYIQEHKLYLHDVEPIKQVMGNSD
ncbi:hypothetical protein CANARDRAFT_230638 [[Candida] arabinofermentans NRRL YB-2248]|uniref:Nicotinamide-nucleotide adenylyltransferase n=1 Tax=[Candida] arabinofermentans NRRL YB-2248 TaxID=983967 RepID=A0A1E4T4K7_9ASCO|nr:hypothetical protein CANARDRAFT_230638 [[Candida] arabinofermentans NRRL YB-2248]